MLERGGEIKGSEGGTKGVRSLSVFSPRKEDERGGLGVSKSELFSLNRDERGTWGVCSWIVFSPT